ncbi:LuxR C-terminal-related transcriptional regulator [Lutibacter sp.]
MYKNYHLTSLLLILLFLVLNPIYSQNSSNKRVIDSLFNELKVKPNTTLKVDNLISLYKKAVKAKIVNEDIINEAISISEKIFYIKGLGESYNRKGLVARYNYDYESSVTFHKRALSYLNKTTDTLLKIKCLNNLGVSYRKLNLEKEAFDFYFQALDLSEKIKSEKSIVIALSGIGNVFIDTKEYEKALHYFKRVYAIDVKKKNVRGQEYSLSNIGEAYLYQKSFDSAYFYINKALMLTKKYKHKQSEAIRYNLLGLLFQKKGEYQKSTNFYKEAIPLFTKENNIRYLSNTLINVGKNQLHLGEYKNAIENITIGLNSAKTIKSKENISLGYNALVDYYTITKNYKEALNSHKIATAFNDSIVNEASQKSIISMQVEYETAKKDAQIQELAKENELSKNEAQKSFNRLIIISSLGLVGIIVLLYLLRLYRKNSDLELENKNSELQNYVLQVKELKEKAISKNFSENFSEFGLSKREIEVLQYISEGLSNDEISEKIFVSNNTIKTHIKNIYSKLDVKNRIQAIKKIKAI